jgi:hypothetical protein
VVLVAASGSLGPEGTLSALYDSTLGMSERTLAAAAVLLARSLKLRYDGTAIASRMPRMMMTTSNSINVKPSSEPSRLFTRSII